MSNANTVSVTFGADGAPFIEGVERIKRSQNSLASDTKGTVAQLKAHWVEVLGVIYSFKEAWDFAEQAAKFDEQKNALNNLTIQYNMTADSMIAAMQRAAEGTISKVNSITVANKGMMMGLDPAQLVKFTEMAKRFSGALGTDVAGAFEKLTQATVVGQERTLKSLGVQVDFQKAQARLAASLGTTAERLTEEERQQANVNEVMRTGAEIIKRMGPDVDTAADAMDRFKAAVSDVSLIVGKIFVSAVSYFVGALAWLSSGFNQWLSSLLDTLAWLVKLGEKIPFVGDKFKGLGKELEDDAKYMNKLAESSMNLSMEAFRVGTTIWKQTEAVKGNTNGHKDNAKAIAATIEQKQKLIEVESQLAETGRKATLEAIKNNAKLELDALDREYATKTIKADEYYTRKRAIEHRMFEESKARVMEAIAAENQLAEAKLKTLTRQPIEVVQAAEIEHANKLIELGQEYNQITNEQTQAEVKNINDLRDAHTELVKQIRAAQKELAILAKENPYQDNLKNYQGDNEFVKDYAKYQDKLDLLKEYNKNVIEEMVKRGATEDQIEAAQTYLSTQYALKERNAKIAYAGDVFAASANLMQNLLIATGSHSKAMFKAMQAFSIAHAIISGIEAAQDAWKWGMKIAGPPGAVIFAAASIAATAARIRQIADTKIDGATSSIGEGGTANPSYSGGSMGAYPPVQPVMDANQKRPLEINLHVYGNVVDHDAFARELVPSITKAINDGVK